MDITIIKGSIDNIDDCEVALNNSELGKQYFSSGSARNALEEGFSKDEIYVALDQNQKCIGFIWFIMKGSFHSFPYIHIVAVKKEIRNCGVGRQLLKFCEEECFKERNKIFLVVADFNPEAKRLYETIGYKEVGTIPGLYRPGITEHLMMKVREDIDHKLS